MTRKNIGMILLLLFLLSACSGKDKYEPFKPLSKSTVSPDREAAVQAALSGNPIQPTMAAPVIVPTDELFDMPNFDEDSFFAEAFQDPENSAGTIPTEVSPFDAVPSVAQPKPTATPVPTVPAVYSAEANRYMYGTQSGLTTYTLQEGEDLVCLGRRFDVSVSSLLSQNQLSSPEEAKAGDTIVLPRNPSPWAMADGYGGRILQRHPTVYTVKSGDNLFSIACSFGNVRPEDIGAKNQLLLKQPLTPGTQIAIP